MSRRRTEHPVDNGSLLNAFLEWMDTSEGRQSIEAHDLLVDALAHARLDAKRRKIVWDDRKRLAIEQSVESIHTAHPDVPRDHIESHVFGCLEGGAPDPYSERQLVERDRPTGPWLADYERKSAAARK